MLKEIRNGFACFVVMFFVGLTLLIGTSVVDAKGFSSSSAGRASSFSSSSRSFSSSSSTSRSSSSFSSSSSKPSTSSSGSVFKSSSSTPSKSTAVTSSYASAGTKRIDSSKVNFADKTTRTNLGSVALKPRSNYIPSTYGTYSRNYYTNSGGFSSNWLMYYMIVDSMSDAAVMTALANRDGYDSWKSNAMASNDPALVAKVNELESRMASLNATNATNGTYIAPEIEAKMKQAVEGAEVVDDGMDIVDMLQLIGSIALALVLIVITGSMIFG